MNTIGKLMSTATLAGALTAMSHGPLWAQATDNAPAENAVAEREPLVELVVENNNWLDAHLYVVRGGAEGSSPDLCVKAEEAPRLRLGCLGDLLFLEE